MIYYEDKVERWIKTIGSFLNYLLRLIICLAVSFVGFWGSALYIREILLKKETGIMFITATIIMVASGTQLGMYYLKKAYSLRRKRVRVDREKMQNPWLTEDERTASYAQVITIQVKEFGEKQWIIQCLDFPPVVTNWLRYSIHNLVAKIRKQSDPELDLLVKIEYPSSIFLEDGLPTEIRIVN